MNIIENQLSQDNMFPKWKLQKFSSFNTTSPSQSENCPTSVPSTTPHPLNIKADKIQSFQDHHHLTRLKLLKISPFKSTTPAQIETVLNHSLLGHHILPKRILFKINPFKIPQPLKVKMIQFPSFQVHYIHLKWKL